MGVANYAILENRSNDKVLVIEDRGPWHRYKTVTNAAEEVVAELHASGRLGTRRLFYYDSDGRKDELTHNGNGVFTGFAPGS
jgi:hypothetical protein